MNTYLTIMVSVLVATQVIRITQNAINLHRQWKSVERNAEWLKNNEDRGRFQNAEGSHADAEVGTVEKDRRQLP